MRNETLQESAQPEQELLEIISFFVLWRKAILVSRLFDFLRLINVQKSISITSLLELSY